MLYENLYYQKEDHVMTVNLPDMGKYDVEMAKLADDVSELCTAVKVERDLRVVIINWEGAGFSSGKDLEEDFYDCGQWGTKPLSLTASVADLDIPVIISINGYAIGQILELALACDIRIASETSHFGLPHIKEGLIPWDGGTQRLPRLIGRNKALELILTGVIVGASEAHRIGLVHKVMPETELLTTGMDMAHEMASKSPTSTRYAKEAICKGMDLSLDQGLRLEADLYFLMHTTRDRTEGIRAFKEKRKARFEGR